MKRRPWSLALLLIVACTTPGPAQRFSWSTYEKMPDDWFRGDEGTEVDENVLAHQSDLGDCPKNIDTSKPPANLDRSRIHGTFVNGATVGEVRFLARSHRATGRGPARQDCFKAIDHVLRAQYPNGGRPLTYPPGWAIHATSHSTTTRCST